MARARMVGTEQVVRGTEGGRSPTGVPPTTAAAAGPGAGVQEAPGATGAKPIPDPAVLEKPVRRRFTAEYKLRVLREADGCSEPGQLGALLRREGLYSSHLSTWRRQRDEGTLAGLAPNRRGRKPKANDPLVMENERLRRENQRLTEKLRQAETIIEVQKNSPRSWGFPCRQPTTARTRHEGRRGTCSADRHGHGLSQPGRVPSHALLTSPAQAARACGQATAQAAPKRKKGTGVFSRPLRA